MKNAKKFTSAILTIVTLLTVLLFTGITSFAATSGDYEYIVLPDGTAEITEYNGNATSLTIPSKLGSYTVASIGHGAFDFCSSLTKVTIPNNVTNIGEYAFYCCESLTNITIPNSVTSIGEDAFYNTAYYNNETNWENDALYIGNHLISVKYTITGTYSIKNGTLTIADSAFSYCEDLTKITIPDSVTSIGESAFDYCQSLTSITIPKNVAYIDEYAFYGCYSLTNITVDSSNKNYSSQDGILFNKDKTILVRYPLNKAGNSYSIPNGVTKIEGISFQGNRNLEGIDFPDSIKEIGFYSFGDCLKVKKINMPSSVKSLKIGISAFKGCDFESINLPNGTSSIGDSAFVYCQKLKSITIPSSVKEIDHYAFSECYALKDVYYTGSATQWNKITIGVKNEYLEKATMHYDSQLSTPKLSSVNNVVAGVKISWGKVTGTEKYRVFYKTGSGSWTKAGDTTSTSYTWTGAKNNTKYTFTVRCIDKDGKNYTSAYDTTGKSITFMSAPTVSVSNVVAGVKVSWGKVSGATNYAIFRKTPDGSYKKIGTATGTSYTDTTAKNNTKYVYAVRCANKDGKTYTSSYNAGKSITFLSAPTVSVSNVVAGVKVSWGKASGASNYAIFRKTLDGSYKKIGTATGTSYTDKTAKNNTKYVYAVRCASKDGKTYTSSYNAGKSKTFMSAPTFTVSNVVAGVQIKWRKVAGASNYAVFRKTANGSYKKIGTTTGTSFVDKTAKSGTKYIYTVRCTSKDGKTYTSSYNAGKSKTFVSAPTFTVSKTSSGIQIKWSKVTGGSNYKVYRKTANGSYKAVGTTTGTSFVDKTAKKGMNYIYTVRCVSKDGKTTTSSYNAGKSITR